GPHRRKNLKPADDRFWPKAPVPECVPSRRCWGPSGLNLALIKAGSPLTRVAPTCASLRLVRRCSPKTAQGHLSYSRQRLTNPTTTVRMPSTSQVGATADPALLTKAQTMPKAIIAKEMRYASIVSMLNTKLLSEY